MKAKIVNCSGDYWYKDKIGEIVNIEYCGHHNKYLLKDEEFLNKRYYFLIDKDDCVEITDEKSLHELLKPKLPKENQMKKLDIKKDYRLEKGIVVNHISDIETEVKLLNDTADVITTIIIGRYGVNLDKANEIINLFNIPYELVDETDWSKVEVGSDVTWTEVHAPDGRLGSFHSYVPSLNKVIVIYGNEIKAVDASEVELC